MLGLIILVVTGIINGYLVRCFAEDQLNQPRIFVDRSGLLAALAYIPTAAVFFETARKGGNLGEAVIIWLVISFLSYLLTNKWFRRSRVR